jgi:hypothetical protein
MYGATALTISLPMTPLLLLLLLLLLLVVCRRQQFVQ